jgi:hypothetical protein
MKEKTTSDGVLIPSSQIHEYAANAPLTLLNSSRLAPSRRKFQSCQDTTT